MIARRTWSFASPGIPSRHVPGEPGTTARAELVVRNEGEAVANVRMSMHHGGRRVDGYRLGVAPGGERSVRVNDLIFPDAAPYSGPCRSGWVNAGWVTRDGAD